VLAVASVVSARLGLSAIPLFIIAGLALGPHTPGPVVIENSEATELIAKLGVVLLLFFLGLEFSLDRLLRARRLVLVGGFIDLAINGGLGLAVGIALFGLGPEAIILAGLIYISSSAIVTRALFDQRRLADDETDLVLGVLVFEDIAVAILLGIAAGLATGEAVGATDVGLSATLAAVFVAAFLVASRWAHLPLDRLVPRLDSEQLLLLALAVAIGGAALAEWAGLSDAVGALLAGILLSGSAIRDRIEQQLLGLRDFAASIFFFAFGVETEIGRLDDVMPWLLLAVPIAVVGKLVGGFAAGRATSFTRRQSLNVGAALVARGEFTVILAQLAATGAALDAEFRERVTPFAGIFVLVTAIVGVVSMRESRRAGRLLFPQRPAKRRPST
jgi:CPA2 family monovalent cation:H+ antiporter-2